MAYVLPGYVVAGYVIDDTPTGPAPVAIIEFAGPTVGGATVVGSATSASIPTAPRLFPDVFVALLTASGLRLFGQRMIPDEIFSVDIGRFSSLIRVGPLDLRTVPLGNDLVASLAASEQATMTLEFDNEDGFWGRLEAREPLLCQPAGIYLWYGGIHLYLAYRGEVQRYVIRQRRVVLELGEP